jgi:geranylgeranyl reductase family protein
VVVVGGGPAGGAAAQVAAQAGLGVCLIDKAVFPRDKLCGGLLTLRSRGVYEAVHGRPWPAEIVNGSGRVLFRADAHPLADVDGRSELYFTMRRDFDAHMLALAGEAGATLRLGGAVKDVDLEQRRLTLQSGEQIGYGHLIGADGASSLVAKALFGRAFDPETIGFGLEVEVPREDLPGHVDGVEIDFGVVDWGYGWIFPKRRTLTLGVGGLHARNPRMRAGLDRYLAAKGLDPARYRPKGQYIPFGDFRPRPGRGRVLLCGDAAGFVDPITGEGIAYAMQTGAAAGRAVAAAIGRGRPDEALGDYQRVLRPVLRSLRQSRAWRQLIFARWSKPTFIRLFGDAGTLQRGFLDILAGKKDYDALPGLLLLQAARAARKLARGVGPRPAG